MSECSKEPDRNFADEVNKTEAWQRAAERIHRQKSEIFCEVSRRYILFEVERIDVLTSEAYLDKPGCYCGAGIRANIYSCSKLLSLACWLERKICRINQEIRNFHLPIEGDDYHVLVYFL